MRKYILNVLKNEKGRYVSGEEISKELGISRTAVWKHINSLKEEGYEIDSRSRAGYMLLNVPDLLLPFEISEGLETKTIGREIYHLYETNSTNDEAKSLAANGGIEGTLVVAERQVKGKGRLGRLWISPQGGIWISIILRPEFQPFEAPKLTLAAALAVTRVLRDKTNLEAQIKWPNDIFINSKKVCGILTEMNAELDRIQYVVLGIGLNVNIDLKKFSEEIGESATSLIKELGRPVDRVKLLKSILTEIEEVYYFFLKKGFPPLCQEVKDLSYTLGRWVHLRQGDKVISGEAIDINEDGALILRTKERQVITVVSGDVGEGRRN
mgnify:CR=1 FL=1